MSRTKEFIPYVVQIGAYDTVLYVNYATDVGKAFKRFMKRHRKLTGSSLREDLYDGRYGYESSKKARFAAARLVRKLERQGYEVIAGGPILNDYWRVYVIGLGGEDKHVYVGETNYPVYKRFQQHVYGFNSARELLKEDILELRPELFEHLPKFQTKAESLNAEAEYARLLREKGFVVEGGT